MTNRKNYPTHNRLFNQEEINNFYREKFVNACNDLQSTLTGITTAYGEKISGVYEILNEKTYDEIIDIIDEHEEEIKFYNDELIYQYTKTVEEAFQQLVSTIHGEHRFPTLPSNNNDLVNAFQDELDELRYNTVSEYYFPNDFLIRIENL